MPTEGRTDPRKNFVPRHLPWLVAGLMLAVYGLTLNRWVSLFNLVNVARTSGWMWQPEVFSPLSFLVMLPLRALSPAAIPLALNLLSAVCGAAALGLLARSVALLPHDRTDAQRKRETSDYAFLTIRSAWLPPVLAAAVCGLQFTFWEHATNCTGEMFDLLLFAFVVWSLLEYRLDEQEWRLYLAALVYGAGMAENWAMVGFFPVFLTAIIWSRKLDFFNLRFLGRMTLFGTAGMLFYLLLPLVTVISGKVPATFWEILRLNLATQWQSVKWFFTISDVRFTLGLLSFSSLIPVFVLSIRWSTGFGDKSRLGVALASFMFHLIHGVLLVFCLWIAFDPPARISPRNSGLGMPFLTFYYLGALSVGYYSGYLLLVFGKKEIRTRTSSRNEPPLRFLDRPIVAGVWLLGLVAITGLIYRNLPQIRAANDDTLRRYASLAESELPRTGGYLLSDDSQHLVLVESALVRDGRDREFVPLDTQSLIAPAYHRWLHRHYGDRWPLIVSVTQTNILNPVGLVQMMNLLGQSNRLYYLHPSPGYADYYFEQFYAEPHGLVYLLKFLPTNTFLPPVPDRALISENEAFWTRTAAPVLAPVERGVAPPDPGAPKSQGEKLLERFHAPREPALNATIAGPYYSRCLDFWSVELERAGELEPAAARFGEALKLNPDNVVARINLDFNQSLRAGRPAAVDLSKATMDRFVRYGTWNDVLNANGPFDEPSFCFETGVGFASQPLPLIHQAIDQFNRVRELAPDNLGSRLMLGQLYVLVGRPAPALDALRAPLEDPARFSLAETNETELRVLAASAYFQETNFAAAARLLDAEIALHPDNNTLLASTVRAYVKYGRYDNALGVINRRLDFTPDDPFWLSAKGYYALQLKNYAAAIAALDRALSVQTNNEDARFNRAIAYFSSDRLDAARADFLRLQQAHTNAFPLALYLAEIAWRQHDTNEAVRNYQIYLAGAGTNSSEGTNILARLRGLEKR